MKPCPAWIMHFPPMRWLFSRCYSCEVDFGGKCYFGHLKWDKWGELIEQHWVSPNNTKYIKLVQERTCVICGAKERREIQ